jgi:hypothetical protein
VKDVLDTLSKLPAVAYFDNPCDGRYSTGAPIIAIKRGVMGFYPIEFSNRDAAWLNEATTTPAQLAAMQAGSLWGWHVPAADPDRYDSEGNLKP